MPRAKEKVSEFSGVGFVPMTRVQPEKGALVAKKRFYAQRIKEIFDASAFRRPMPVTGMNEFLYGAMLATRGRNGGATDVPEARDLMTYVVRDPRFEGKAVVMSYSRETIDSLARLMNRLNPQHIFNSAVAPTVEYSGDVFAQNSRGRMVPSGGMLVLRQFDHLDAVAINAHSGIPSHKIGGVYRDIADTLMAKGPACQVNPLAMQQPGLGQLRLV